MSKAGLVEASTSSERGIQGVTGGGGQALQQIDDLLGGVNLGGFQRPRIQDATLGYEVQRMGKYAPADTQGKYLGLGTVDNAGQGYFNTKELVLLTPEVADFLTNLYQQESINLSALANRGNIPSGVPLSAGLGGFAFVNGANQFMDPYFDAQEGFRANAIDQYFPDDRCRISVSNVDAPDAPLTLLPGSARQIQALANGLAVGLAFVKNPGNTTGYLRVGSAGWRNALAKYVNGTMPASEEDMHHLFGQGAVYGLGHIYASFDIPVQILNYQAASNGTEPVRFFVGHFEGEPVPQNAVFYNLQNYISDPVFMNEIADFYGNYLKNPDQVRLGRYGAANLFLRHADKMNLTAPGLDAEDRATFNQAVIDAFQQDGSMRQLGAHWAGQYKDFDQRRGLSAFPLRKADGTPLTPAQSTWAGNGECNIFGSGPLMTQNARVGPDGRPIGEQGYKFYKFSKKYRSRAGGEQGRPLSNAYNKTYHCGDTPDYVINPDRETVYGRGKIRTAPDASLEEFLDSIQDQVANYNEQTGGDADYSADELRTLYADWVSNPEARGTNPYFMRSGENGIGFARFAPREYEGMIEDPEERQAFARTNLTQRQALLRSQRRFAQKTGAGNGGGNF